MKKSNHVPAAVWEMIRAQDALIRSLEKNRELAEQIGKKLEGKYRPPKKP